jgi:coenzyme F420-0:L-glutamate ligase/coenzyme F420-1:gamma-L-glutamate ligase
MSIEITALSGLPEIRAGDDLAALVREAAGRDSQTMDRSTIVAIAQKVISKVENEIVNLREVRPSAMAQSWAQQWGKDPRLIEVILSQSKRIVKMDRGVMVVETHHGFVCANAGVDQSNAGAEDRVTLLPRDPDASARRLRDQLGCGAVIVTDTFGRPWREGLVDVAIGVAGFDPVTDYRGSADRGGRKLEGTIIALGDQIAAAAGLLMSKSAGTPVVLVRGLEWKKAEGSTGALLRKCDQDLFR